MGPTASGKSDLALALAERTGAEILNADSMQVYRDLRILTNRPTAEEEARAPHRLFGHIDAAVRFSVAAWLAEANEALLRARAAGRPAIVVGGAGLYFRALTQGLAPVPAQEEIRAGLLRELAAEGPAALHARLAELDPEGAAALSPQDAPRLVRALEALLASGRPLREAHAQSLGGLPREAWRGLCLNPEREALRTRIAARFDQMLQDGALEEIKTLAARGLDPGLPAMKAHGAPWLMAHLRGELPLEQAKALAVRDTQRYAKRQRTWMAHQMADWPRLVAKTLHERITGALAIWSAVDATAPQA